MILRRLSKAIQEQNWFTVTIEIFIVMIGIFLGLQVTKWNNARIDRADEADFLVALHQDIVEMQSISEKTLTMRLTYFNDLKQAAKILFGEVNSRSLTAAECKAIVVSHIVSIIPSSLPSLTALRDAGRTGILKDKRLLTNLAKLTQRQEALEYIINGVERTTYNMASLHPDLLQIKPVKIPIKGQSDLEEYDLLNTCDSEGLAISRSALNGIAVNLDGYDGTIRLARAWAEQTNAVHLQLDDILGIQHEEITP